MNAVKYVAALAAVALAGCAVTPKPLTDAEFERRAGDDLGQMFRGQAPVTHPITLPEAMARAIRYNLDHRLKMMETALARANLKAVQFEELPKLTASAGYHQRSNDTGGVSQAIETRTQSLVASTSQERVRVTGEVAVAWNILDFGISYARAQQQAGQVMLAMERRRKVVQNIIQDVRYAWWRAVSAEIMLKELKRLMTRATAALAHSEQMEKQAIQSPQRALEYQRDLLQDIRQLWQLVQRLSMAKTELAALINLKPGTPFRVAIPGNAFARMADLRPDMAALEKLALINRPELRQEDYQQHIDALEVRKAMLRMLPGIEFNAGYSYDSNKFLFNNSWGSASEAVTWNIFQLFSGPAAIRAAKTQLDVGKSRRLALSMAVVTQMHLAYQRYRLARKDFELESRISSVQDRLSSQAGAMRAAGTGDELAQIRGATAALVARMRRADAYAEMQNALGRLFNSLGLDAVPSFTRDDVDALAAKLTGQTDAWIDELNRLGRNNDMAPQTATPTSGNAAAGRPESGGTSAEAEKPASLGRNMPAPITPATEISEAPAASAAESAPQEAAAPAATGPVLRGVYPSSVPGSHEPQLLIISGRGFDAHSRVSVDWGGGEKRLPASRVQWLDSGHIAMRIKTGTVPGAWSVTVTDGKGATSNTVRFEVVGPAE